MSNNGMFGWCFIGAGMPAETVAGEIRQGLVCPFEKEGGKLCD